MINSLFFPNPPPNQRYGVSSSHTREKNWLFQKIKIKEFYYVVYYFVRKKKNLVNGNDSDMYIHEKYNNA